MNSIKYNETNITPNKVICIGRNFVEHIEELKNEVPRQMVIFFKPNTSVSGEVKLHDDEVTHFESELSFLIKDGKFEAVSFGLDLTKREVQSILKEKGLPWERAKAFRASAIFSEFVSFESLEDLNLTLHVNNKLVQKGGVDMMINKPYDILKEVLTFSDIDENDILMCGTPKGVGILTKGDILEGCVYEKDRLLIKCEWVVS